MPSAARRRRVGRQDAFPCGAAHSVFHGHHQHAENHKKHKVNQDEESSAVLSHHVRKTPDVSDADGTAGGKHDEAEAASEIFTLFNIFSPQISLM